MHDIRVDKLADLLVNYSVGVRPGDRVAIFSPELARPLTEALFVAALKAGGHPLVMAPPQQTSELLFRYASKEQLEFVHHPAGTHYRAVRGAHRGDSRGKHPLP